MLPVDGPPIERGGVAVEDGRIVAVGPANELEGEPETFPESAIVPGLVNAHSHLEYAVYAGFGDGLADFGDWISLHQERKNRIGWGDYLAIARWGASECLAGGVTTVGDASFSGAAAVAADELGLRAIVYLEVFGADPDEALRRFAELRERAGDRVGGRITIGISPHAPYTISLETYRACAELGIPVATHISESRSEVEFLETGGGPWAGLIPFLVRAPGKTGTRLLADEGLLGPVLVAAHCTVVDADEIALLAEHDVAVVHCPRSNALLGCGFAPLTELRAAGIRVGLGTDSPASTPSFDMFEEMRTAVYVARGRERNPAAITASDALELATLGSARALGLDAEVGSLAPGKRADLAVVSLSGSPYLPWEDPAAAVVFGGSPERIELTLVDGEERYRRGGERWPELRRSAERARARMLGEARPDARPPTRALKS